MKLQFDTDPQTFLGQVASNLEVQAAVHSFILSLTTKYAQTQKPMSLLVRDTNLNAAVLAAGVQTETDRALVISNMSVQDADKFAELLALNLDSLAGVNGPVPAVDVFAEKWSSLKAMPTKLCTNLRLFELTKLVPARAADGHARAARVEDRDVLAGWLKDFRNEAAPDDPLRSEEERYQAIDSGTADGHYFVWESGGVLVCLVGNPRSTSTESWIGPVYTPPEFRGRGYGAALTAFVSEIILASGKKGMLFTDLSNPTSNGIYQSIGYRPVADFKHFAFL